MARRLLYQLPFVCGGWSYQPITLHDHEEFRFLSAVLRTRFKSSPTVQNDFKFAGITIERTPAHVRAKKTRTVLKLRPLSTEADFPSLKSRLMETAWAVHTRPDLADSIASLAQVTQAMFDVYRSKALRAINQLVKQANLNSSLVLTFLQLKAETL